MLFNELKGLPRSNGNADALSGVKRTFPPLASMSVIDPERTSELRGPVASKGLSACTERSPLSNREKFFDPSGKHVVTLVEAQPP
jgi:hypothetical protein